LFSVKSINFDKKISPDVRPDQAKSFFKSNFLKHIQMKIPAELKYTEDHEWVRIEGNMAVVGITDYAQNELGDVVFVEIETEGEELEMGDTFGTVEAVKTVSDLFMPIAGKVTEVNAALADEPEFVNKDPYGKGWMIKIEASSLDEADALLSADDYKKMIEA
jgi:glycine cleavage system H protein